MRLENSFAVDVPADRAWTALLDVPTVVACMPGVELRETVSPDAWKATLSVKLGPVALAFDADVTRELVDAERRLLVLAADAREVRGRGGATTRIETTVVPLDDRSSIEIVSEVRLSGPAAQFGRPVVQDVARRLTARFASCLQTTLARDR